MAQGTIRSRRGRGRYLGDCDWSAQQRSRTPHRVGSPQFRCHVCGCVVVIVFADASRQVRQRRKEIHDAMPEFARIDAELVMSKIQFDPTFRVPGRDCGWTPLDVQCIMSYHCCESRLSLCTTNMGYHRLTDSQPCDTKIFSSSGPSSTDTKRIPLVSWHLRRVC